MTYDGGGVSIKSEEGGSDTKEYPCLLRVTDGKGNELLGWQAETMNTAVADTEGN